MIKITEIQHLWFQHSALIQMVEQSAHNKHIYFCRKQHFVKYNKIFFLSIKPFYWTDLHLIPKLSSSWVVQQRALKNEERCYDRTCNIWCFDSLLCMVSCFYPTCRCKYMCAVASIRLVRRGRTRPVIGCWQQQKAGAQQTAEPHLRASTGPTSGCFTPQHSVQNVLKNWLCCWKTLLFLFVIKFRNVTFGLIIYCCLLKCLKIQIGVHFSFVWQVSTMKSLGTFSNRKYIYFVISDIDFSCNFNLARLHCNESSCLQWGAES